MADQNDAADPLGKLRGTVEKAIAEHRAYTSAAGSPEMRSAQTALMHLGNAYSALRPSREPNPAWPDGVSPYGY